jgi:hypothetical protein
MVEQNLEGLMADVPDMTLEDIPRCDQRHTVGFLHLWVDCSAELLGH